MSARALRLEALRLEYEKVRREFEDIKFQLRATLYGEWAEARAAAAEARAAASEARAAEAEATAAEAEAAAAAAEAARAAAEARAAAAEERAAAAAFHAKLKKDAEEFKILCGERQKGLEALQAELERAGLFTEKFDFSKLASPEETKEEPRMIRNAYGDWETEEEYNARTQHADGGWPNVRPDGWPRCLFPNAKEHSVA